MRELRKKFYTSRSGASALEHCPIPISASTRVHGSAWRRITNEGVRTGKRPFALNKFDWVTQQSAWAREGPQSVLGLAGRAILGPETHSHT
jgi:hypothetical protein